MITSFKGQHEFLSSFHRGHPFRYPACEHSNEFATVEHCFQAYKATSVFDFQKVLSAPHPGEAKARGRKIACRPDWDGMKRRLMLDIQVARFTQHPDLEHLLAMTGDQVLIEGNTWGDDYWGMVPAREHSPDNTWDGSRELAGENWLGRILMMVREVIS